jgi:phage FluMu protein Com
MVRTQALASRTIRMHDTAIAVTCPKCKSRLKFIRPTLPHIDECGFESHRFRCESCASLLAGIIDPSDGELLVSLSEEPTLTAIPNR